MNVFATVCIGIVLFAAACARDLIFVSFIHRHGDRSPILIYPTDPYGVTVWRNREGQLTNLGKNQGYELGRYIRKRYPNLLSSIFDVNEIFVLSSDMDRTLMTAYCVLAGLYPPIGEDVWLKSMPWQPIPVRCLPKQLDNLIAFSATCPKLKQLLNEHTFRGNPKIIDKYRENITEMATYAGIHEPYDILTIALYMADCFSIEEQQGLELPEWTKQFYPELLGELAKLGLGSITSFDVQTNRLQCGPLLKDIIQQMEDVTQGISKVKMRQYSGHDITIMEILKCMNIYDGELVPFLAALFFELYKTENGFEVAIYYKKHDEIQELVIPGCKSHCPLDLFKQLVKNVIPDNWEEECKL